jgi:hypothetical protein
MIYRKLKRVWSYGESNYIQNFDKVFPELKKLSREEMCDRWMELDIEFYSVKQKPVKWWVRLTLPFALLTILLMFISLPVHFIIHGNWGYSLDRKNNRIYNWFKSLRLV